MTTLLILNTNGFDENEARLCLKEELYSRISARKNEKERILSGAAYTLLCSFYKDNFSPEVPTIVYTEEGKPYFLEEENIEKNEEKATKTPRKSDTGCPVFSISHSGELAVVAISDEVSSVGVDVQIAPRASVIKRIAARFFGARVDTWKIPREISSECAEKAKAEDGQGDVCVACLKSGYKTLYYNIKEGKITPCTEEEVAREFSPRTECSDAEETELVKWCVLESDLKASGGGFADFSDAQKIELKTRTDAMLLSLGGKTYALSLSMIV